MGNQESSMSYTLSYDDSGFSDVTATPLEAKFSSEYESGLKSMFLQTSQSDEDEENADTLSPNPVVLTVKADSTPPNTPSSFVTSTPRVTRPITFHKSLKSEFEAYSDGNSRNSSQEREDEEEEDEALGESMFDSQPHNNSARLANTLAIRHRRTTTNTTDSISESDDHSHRHQIDEEHEEDAVFSSCSCPKCHPSSTYQINQRKAYSSSWSPKSTLLSQFEEKNKKASSNSQVDSASNQPTPPVTPTKSASYNTQFSESGARLILLEKSGAHQLLENEDESSVKSLTPPASSSYSRYSLYSYSSSLLKGMNYVGKLAKGFKDFYNEINPATLTGAIDVIVIRQEDGSYKCSPFHVRFGKLGVIRSRERIVDIEINGQQCDLHMKLGDAGEAYFVEEVEDDGESSDDDSTTGVSTRSSKLDKNSDSSSLLSTSELSSLKMTKSITSTNVTQPIEIMSRSLSTHTLKEQTSQLVAEETSHPIKVIVNEETTTSSLVKSSTAFFSDGELTPELTSPAVSRPPTPKSDTELEPASLASSGNSKLNKRQSLQAAESNQWRWSWGQLPERQNQQQSSINTSETSDIIVNMNKSESVSPPSTGASPSSPSGLLSMFSSIKSNKSDQPPGIYLEETEKLDSEVAALYIDQKSSKKSQQQLSKTASNVSVDDTASTMATLSTTDSGRGTVSPLQSPREPSAILGDVQISLCGFSSIVSPPPPSTISSNINTMTTSNLQVNEVASSAQISSSYSPTNSSLLLSISPVSTSTIYSPSASQLASPTPSTTDLSLQIPENSGQISNYEELFQQHIVPLDKFLDDITSIVTNPNLVIKLGGKYMNWASASPIILSALVYQKQLSSDTVQAIIDANSGKSKIIQQQLTSSQANSSNSQSQQSLKTSSSGWGKNFGGLFWNKRTTSTSGTASTPTQQTLNPITTTTSSSSSTDINKPLKSLSYDETAESQSNSVFIDSTLTNVDSSTSLTQDSTTSTSGKNKRVRYRKMTRLSSEQIKSLNLMPGANEIKFSVTTALQGTTRIESYIFLWEYDDRIIVSDIDGTITKSDVWGQVLPIFGRDWTQAGVADLFTAIERNQYKFIYLSARAIGQSSITRQLLRKINQDGFTLPEGPLLVTPTSLFTAFQKEVIEKKPEEFKISCLRDIKSLFPEEYNPYYAGYGNKPTDVRSYKTVGIPESRIFTINPQGEVKHEVSRTFQSSYSKLCDYVELIFPPPTSSASATPSRSEYDSFAYWRQDPVVDLAEIEEEVKKISAASGSGGGSAVASVTNSPNSSSSLTAIVTVKETNRDSSRETQSKDAATSAETKSSKKA